MKWPFARRAPSSASTAGPAPASPSRAVGALGTETNATAVIAAPTRRDWATLPPMRVASERPITLTAQPRAFVDQLATRQPLVHSPRLEHVRRMDAPSGSFRGLLTPEPAADHAGHVPELHEPSPLPAVDHRRAVAVAGDEFPTTGLSAVEQLLAIGENSGQSSPAPRPSLPTPIEEGERIGPGDELPRTERRSLADSRRLGLGPAYHGPLPNAIQAERARAAERDVVRPGEVRSELIPTDVRSTMRDVLGMDIGDRLVHRGPAVSAEARSMGAEAFTRGGEVFVGDDVGPLDQPRGRATLAHELTHVAQQIVHGVVPEEQTVTGRIMEAHAQSVEQYVRGDAAAPKPGPELLHARPPASGDQLDAELVASTQQMVRELIDSGFARSDGRGGMVFTMPPSAMTGHRDSQRLTNAAPAAQPGAAAREQNWSGLAVFGNTMAQGLASDMLSITGSVFGFSDEFMGEQRAELADANRAFRREQTKQAYQELRLEHLRHTELDRRSTLAATEGHERPTTLDEATVHALQQQVETEVQQRMNLLEAQTNRALEQLNRDRTAHHDSPLAHVPDESYDTAFHRLFDNPDVDQLPGEDEILTMLTRSTGGGGRPSGGGTPGATGGAPGGTPGAHAGGAPGSPSPAGGTGSPGTGHDTGTSHGTGTGTSGTGQGGGTGGTAHHDEPWRTNQTMGGRFSALGTALIGDIAHEEVGIFGSLLGFDEGFARGLHQDIDRSLHPTVAGGRGGTGGHAGTTTPAGAHGGEHPAGADHGAHAGAAHADGAHAGADPHATGLPAAQDTVEHIVGDPYALDELATRIYPNIRSRLRQELLIDRERAGLLADFR